MILIQVSDLLLKCPAQNIVVEQVLFKLLSRKKSSLPIQHISTRRLKLKLLSKFLLKYIEKCIIHNMYITTLCIADFGALNS